MLVGDDKNNDGDVNTDNVNDDNNGNDNNAVTYFPTISVFQTLRQPPKTSLIAIIFQ